MELGAVGRDRGPRDFTVRRIHAASRTAGRSCGRHRRNPYAPDENLEPIDVAEIDRARKTIDISAYVLTDNAIIDALARGPAWRRPQGLARSRDWRNGRTTTILSPGLGETPEGIQIPTKAAGGALMHLKGYCVDGLVLRAGSANFSRSDETQRDNDLVIARGKEARAKSGAKFAKAWEWSK